MSCSNQNTILTVTDAALAVFSTLPSALEAYGKLSPTQASTLQGYSTDATNTLTQVVTDIETNSSTLSKIAATVQTLVTQFNGVGAGLPGIVGLSVNLANSALQTVVSVINQQMALDGTVTVSTPAPVGAPSSGSAVAPNAALVTVPVPAVAHTVTAAPAAKPETPIHTSIFQRGHLNGMKKTLADTHAKIAQLTAATA